MPSWPARQSGVGSSCLTSQNRIWHALTKRFQGTIREIIRPTFVIDFFRRAENGTYTRLKLYSVGDHPRVANDRAVTAKERYRHTDAGNNRPNRR